MATERFSCEACGKWFEFETNEGEDLGDVMACPFCDLGEAKRMTDKACKCRATGRYKYNRKLARMVKVSDATPGLAGGGGGCGGCSSGSCGSCGCH